MEFSRYDPGNWVIPALHYVWLQLFPPLPPPKNINELFCCDEKWVAVWNMRKEEVALFIYLSSSHTNSIALLGPYLRVAIPFLSAPSLFVVAEQ